MTPFLRRLAAVLRERWPLFAAAAFGLLVFLAQGGAAILSPVDVRWIPAGKDWGYHWIGWLYFRAAPWQLPLGDTPNLLWPVGTTVGFMDGLPWLSTLLKLFSPILPDTFQWVGPYIGLCFVLQGYFGARLIAAITPSPPTAAIGGGLYAIAPVLLNRIRHMALCSHFVILAALTTVVRREERARLAPIWLPALTMGIHPYLTFIVLGIAFATLLRYRIEGLVTTVGLLVRLTIMLAGVAAVAALFGFFMHGGTEVAGRGFGFFNSELLSLVNSGGASHIMPKIPMRQGQGEGYGFLGPGIILLGISALVVEIRARRRGAPALPWRRVAPLIAVGAIYAVFSWGSKVSVLGHDLLDVTWLYPAYTGSIFRASGRFIWIMTYTLTTGAIAIWAIRQPRLAPYVLAAALIFQFFDTKDAFFTRRFGGPRTPPAQSADWQLAAGSYDKMILFPPRCGDGGGVCCEGFTPPPLNEDMYLAALAVHLGLSYNGFGAGRVARSKHAVYCKAIKEEVAGNHLDPKSIYVVARDREPQFRKANPTAPCKKLDAELVCVAPTATGPFRDQLAGI